MAAPSRYITRHCRSLHFGASMLSPVISTARWVCAGLYAAIDWQWDASSYDAEGDDNNKAANSCYGRRNDFDASANEDCLIRLAGLTKTKIELYVDTNYLNATMWAHFSWNQ